MADFILKEAKSKVIQVIDEDDSRFARDFIFPVDGGILLDNVPRLFPRWMLDFFSRGGSFNVLGNQSSDMEVLSLKLFYDLKGYEASWDHYGDLAIFDSENGWKQYFIDVRHLRLTGELRLGSDLLTKTERDEMDGVQSQLIFQKTKFGTWINFPWYLTIPGLEHGINPLMLADMYVKASSAKFEVAPKS